MPTGRLSDIIIQSDWKALGSLFSIESYFLGLYSWPLAYMNYSSHTQLSVRLTRGFITVSTVYIEMHVGLNLIVQ